MPKRNNTLSQNPYFNGLYETLLNFNNKTFSPNSFDLFAFCLNLNNHFLCDIQMINFARPSISCREHVIFIFFIPPLSLSAAVILNEIPHVVGDKLPIFSLNIAPNAPLHWKNFCKNSERWFLLGNSWVEGMLLSIRCVRKFETHEIVSVQILEDAPPHHLHCMHGTQIISLKYLNATNCTNVLHI